MLIKLDPLEQKLKVMEQAMASYHFARFMIALYLQQIKDLSEDPENIVGEAGSIQDPKLKELTATQILAKIRKEKMSLDNDSFFDDCVTLYIGIRVAFCILRV